MSTALEIACPVLVCGGFVYGAIRHLFATPGTEQPVDVVEARMDAAPAAMDHPGRRAALTHASHQHREG